MNVGDIYMYILGSQEAFETLHPQFLFADPPRTRRQYGRPGVESVIIRALRPFFLAEQTSFGLGLG
jgi:hypothetical protein